MLCDCAGLMSIHLVPLQYIWQQGTVLDEVPINIFMKVRVAVLEGLIMNVAKIHEVIFNDYH